MKTNKSFTKRLKFTKNGKVIARKPGQNHFNNRDSAKAGINKKRSAPFTISAKTASRFYVNAR